MSKPKISGILWACAIGILLFALLLGVTVGAWNVYYDALGDVIEQDL